ncbi:alpha/beta fold hydrolase [Microbulbifer sp. S227A]|uniref:alpha/beta fold hydrolase n=1 Tax=Microbulbifer sp. S227A TaxID=3415131 RepID=UPI003C7B058A
MTYPLILLPGMMCDARLFRPQIDALSGRVALMTAPVGGHDTMRALAAEVLANAPPRFAIAGLSMGGILAMEVVRQAPDRVAGLALMDTNPLAELDEIKARRAPQIAAAEAGELDRIMRDQMIPNYLPEGASNTAITDLCMDMAMGLGAGVFVNQSKALRDRIDQRDTLRAFRGPALVLCGRGDRLCPPERHDLMHDLIPTSTLAVIEGAGHLPTLERPEETTAALSRWLEDV